MRSGNINDGPPSAKATAEVVADVVAIDSSPIVHGQRIMSRNRAQNPCRGNRAECSHPKMTKSACFLILAFAVSGGLASFLPFLGHAPEYSNEASCGFPKPTSDYQIALD
eukprot:GHVO01053016.1.p1 GENE.GHVO01053016.1~~GHVO01053016.1.p1  ORF type:complete len:110 (-),score=4.21 GHVO01053016.1:534-863(-)